jgi:co-chaperonin GroES (HSP10)
LRLGPTANVNFGNKKVEGAKIIFSKYGGFNIDLPDFGDRDFRIINDEDVLAVIGEKDG